MNKFKIEFGQFMQAFCADSDYTPCPQSAYLHLKTGGMVFVFNNDDHARINDVSDNAETRDMVAREKESYLEIPAHSHAEHHDILQEFLVSGWTSNKDLKGNAEAQYHFVGKSIGRWKKAVSQDVYEEFKRFSEERMERDAEAFLRANGVDPIWH